MRATASLIFFWGRRDCHVLQLWYCRVLQLWYVTYLISCPSLVRYAAVRKEGWRDMSSMEETCDGSLFTPW